MVTTELIASKHAKLPDYTHTYIHSDFPFLFLDFEVFKHDWLVCFSIDGIHIKYIVNDVEKLKKLFLKKYNNRVLIAYNGLGYDKYILLALLNDLNPKEVNDEIINNFNFNNYVFINKYGNNIKVGNDLMWYEPSSRLDGSLKTFEACEGENIYESEIDFNLDRKLTEDEINETINYCSFDVKMLIKYFYEVNFDSFLGHFGLINSTLKARPYLKFEKVLPKTDASLVGTYLCSEAKPVTTKSTDTIKLPPQIQCGKYTKKIEKFLQIPILTLKNGSYNGLNSWSLNIIKKGINKCDDIETLQKLKNKEEKCINSLKKIKLEIQKLKEKENLTEKQELKLQDLPNKLIKEKEKLVNIRNEIIEESNILDKLKDLKIQLNQYEENVSDSNYNFIVKKILEITKPTDNNKFKLLLDYLSLSNDEIFKLQYETNKKETIYNSIMVEYPFELILNIKGIPHAFKTGGLHSVYPKSLFFDKSSEKDKNKTLIIADVGSLYPNLMRVFGLCSIGMDDPSAYAQMISDRIVLKKQGDPFAGVLKLILNTTYGCMGSASNLLYDPANRLKVCIFGQAAIIDLLDKLEDNVQSLEIYQSNTDGIIISSLNEEADKVVEIIHEWEHRTGLEMEIESCIKLAQKDVSNYILVKE